MTTTWWSRAVTWWNCNVSWPRARRQLFYSIVSEQLAAGNAPRAALETMARTMVVDKATARAARTAAAGIAAGGGLADGLAATRSVPAEEVGRVRVAEARSLLQECLAELGETDATRLGIVRSVIAPNSYYLFFLALGLLGVAEAKDFMIVGTITAESLADNAAFRLSSMVNAYGPPAGAGLAALAVVVVVGREGWHGRLRAALGVFDREHRSQVAIRFTGFAAGLYRHGATHQEVLRGFEEAYGRRGFQRWAVREVWRDHVEAGIEYETALKGRLLSPGFAEMLSAMVPGGDRDKYARGCEKLMNIVKRTLEARFAVARNMVRFGAVALIGGLLGIVVPGALSAYTTM